jgi:Zn-dependent peptidase ImmA (M78 family)
MMLKMNPLQIQAYKKAGQIRTRLKLDIIEPVNVFDASATLGLQVRFVDISMEGMYVSQEDSVSPFIFLSSLRPLPRRVYTCGHELGHHLFGHGSKVDGLTEEGANAASYDKDEYLVDTFAGAFLMPIAGVDAEFSKRNWSPKKATPFQFYTISSVFGTGYSTLITHSRANNLIDEATAVALLKLTPARLLADLIGKGEEKSHFKVFDAYTLPSKIDLEVGNYLFVTENVEVEGSHLRFVKRTAIGNAFIATQPGITRAICSKSRSGCFIRIQNAGYVGLAEYRHLENKND